MPGPGVAVQGIADDLQLGVSLLKKKVERVSLIMPSACPAAINWSRSAAADGDELDVDAVFGEQAFLVGDVHG